MVEEDIITNDDSDDEYDYWMDPAVAEKMEMEKEKKKKWRKLYAKDESSEEPDFDFQTDDAEELFQYEREQLSKKNLETSFVHFIKHRELALEKPRTISLKRFLQSRNFCAQLRKCDPSYCFEEESNHTILRCFGNRLYNDLKLIEKLEKLTADEDENMLRKDLETLKSVREYMNSKRENK